MRQTGKACCEFERCQATGRGDREQGKRWHAIKGEECCAEFRSKRLPSCRVVQASIRLDFGPLSESKQNDCLLDLLHVRFAPRRNKPLHVRQRLGGFALATEFDVLL